MHGGITMGIKTYLHGQVMTLKRSLIRDVVPVELDVKPRSLRGQMHILMHAGEEGNALVEFALILPMLLMLTTGLMVFGVAMNNYLQLTHAVSVGARSVSLYGHDASTSSSIDPCSLASAAVISAAPGLNPANMTFSYSFGSSTASSTSCTGAAASLVSRTNVTVTATYPLNLSIYGKVFSQSSAVLSASATELVQ
jgi:Flp pilus assembly protein TadG